MNESPDTIAAACRRFHDAAVDLFESFVEAWHLRSLVEWIAKRLPS